MNQTEIKYLTDKRLSHAARSLYAFFLKPNFEQNKKHIDLVAVVNYLNTESKNFKTSIDYERAALLLKELEDLNLIKRDDLSSAWHGAQITLPYYVIEGNTLPDAVFAMRPDWKPGPNFTNACYMCGLEDPAYEKADLSAFVSYWCSHLEQRNQTAWERAFAQRLLKKRMARVYVKNSNNVSEVNQTLMESSVVKKDTIVSAQEQQQRIDELNNLFK